MFKKRADTFAEVMDGVINSIIVGIDNVVDTRKKLVDAWGILRKKRLEFRSDGRMLEIIEMYENELVRIDSQVASSYVETDTQKRLNNLEGRVVKVEGAIMDLPNAIVDAMVAKLPSISQKSCPRGNKYCLYTSQWMCNGNSSNCSEYFGGQKRI